MNEEMLLAAAKIGQQYNEVNDFLVDQAEKFVKACSDNGIRLPNVFLWDTITWEPRSGAGVNSEGFYGRNFDGESGNFTVPHAWITDPRAWIAQEIEAQKARDAAALARKQADVAERRRKQIIDLQSKLAELQQQEEQAT